MASGGLYSFFYLHQQFTVLINYLLFTAPHKMATQKKKKKKTPHNKPSYYIPKNNTINSMPYTYTLHTIYNIILLVLN